MADSEKRLLPTWPELRKRLVLSGICAVILAPATIILREVLSGLRVLDPIARVIRERIANISPSLAGWTFALVVVLVVQVSVVWWFTRKGRHLSIASTLPSRKGPPWRDPVSGRRFDMGEYGSSPNGDEPPEAWSEQDELDLQRRRLEEEARGYSDEWKWRAAKEEGRAKVERDKALGEALAYYVEGRWGFEFFDSLKAGHNPGGAPLEQVLQLGYDGKLTIWGKRFEAGVYEIIPKAYWADHHIDLFSLMRRKAKTVANTRAASDTLYFDLMVSRAQFEQVMPCDLGGLWARIRNEGEHALEDKQIPFIALRELATEYGISFERYGPLQNTGYGLEGALKEAAANGRLLIWGRPYQGPVRDHDPLIPIPAEHFHRYSFKHGALEYQVSNDQTCTATMAMQVKGKAGLEGETFYDLDLAEGGARSVLAKFAKLTPEQQQVWSKE